MAVKHGLGRGLNALIKEPSAAPAKAAPPAAVVQTPAPAPVPVAPVTPVRTGVEQFPVDQIRDNPYQPRRHFATEALDDLVKSIQTHGVLSPLWVRRVGEHVELVAGERRLRAARQVGLATVPVSFKDVSDRDAMELSLIENLQREDLNPIEEAEGYARLGTQFGLSQEEIAQRVGKGRATVTNAMRLLALPEDIRQMLADGQISTGHAKVLLSVPIDEEKRIMARRVVAEGLSVREIEKAVARLDLPPRKARASRSDIPPDHLKDLSDRLHRHFGTMVRIFPSRTLADGKRVKGTVEIDFFSNDDLSRIMDVCGLSELE